MENGKKQKKKLPADIEFKRTRAVLNPETVSHTSTYEAVDAFKSLGFDNSFDLDEFKENFQIKILKMTKEEAEFELIGIDPAIANALRRILISEIPTMAIETVFIANNTGVIQDEVLAHRLGLIPIYAPPQDFEYKQKSEEYSDKNTIVFDLKITCKRNPNASEESAPEEKYVNSKVYSSDLIWQPQGTQAETMKDDPPKPVHPDILITKLRPGQSLELRCYCEKGIGQTHAKWSPVSTASYRLLPEITLLKPVKNKEAEELVKLCPMKVFDIEDLGKGEKQAKVARPRHCTMCRECIREPKWQEKVRLSRVKNHFIFSIESTGIYHAGDLFKEALKVLLQKCETLEFELSRLSKQSKMS